MAHYVREFVMYEDGKEVFRGTAIEIEKAYEEIESRDRVYAYAKLGTNLYGKYTFKDAGKRFVPDEKEKKPKKVSKHDKELEYLVTHLRIYGNVFFHKRADRYKKELEEMGIRFTTRKCSVFKDGFILERI